MASVEAALGAPGLRCFPRNRWHGLALGLLSKGSPRLPCLDLVDSWGPVWPRQALSVRTLLSDTHVPCPTSPGPAAPAAAWQRKREQGDYPGVPGALP